LFTHTPIFWLVLGLVIFFASSTDFGKVLGLVVWLSAWSHLILDSERGIMWFWPATKRFFPFTDSFYKKKYQLKYRQSESFFKYWFWVVLNGYMSLSGLVEILIIVLALIVLF
jgi:hypothetical protein